MDCIVEPKLCQITSTKGLTYLEGGVVRQFDFLALRREERKKYQDSQAYKGSQGICRRGT